MNPNERRRSASIPEVAENANGIANLRQEIDVEFGDFEGFEDAAAANIQAAAGPSPWATFPDLLPVQTSPANPSNDESASANPVVAVRGHNDNEPWMMGAIGGAENPPHMGHLNHPNYNQGPTRAVSNPPDISLISACCQSSGGPFNGLDPVSGDPRQIGIASISEMDARHQREGSFNIQVSELQQHVEVLTLQRTSLENQLAEAVRESQRVAESLRESVSQVHQLQAQQRQADNDRQEGAEQLNASVLQDFTSTLHQIRESMETIQLTQAEDRRTVRDLQESMSQLLSNRKPTNDSKTTESEAGSAMTNLSSSTECSDNIEQIIESTVQRCLREQRADMLQSQEQNGHQQCSCNCRAQEYDDLKGYMEQIKEVMESERRNYASMLTRSLQTALKQVSVAFNSINLEEDNCKGSSSKS